MMADQRLTPELKAKWLEALRSGQYVQGRSQLLSGLSDETRYCCLGVLAICAGVRPEGLHGKLQLTDLGRDDLLGEWGDEDEFSVSERHTWRTTQQKLAGMNDTGKSFSEIADWIEKNL